MHYFPCPLYIHSRRSELKPFFIHVIVVPNAVIWKKHTIFVFANFHNPKYVWYFSMQSYDLPCKKGYISSPTNIEAFVNIYERLFDHRVNRCHKMCIGRYMTYIYLARNLLYPQFTLGYHSKSILFMSPHFLTNNKE